MGCSCSKDLDLLHGGPQPETSKGKGVVGALLPDQQVGDSHTELHSKNGSLPLHTRTEGPLPSISKTTSTPTRTPLKEVQQSSLSSSSPPKGGRGSASSPSTPSTVHVDDDEDDEEQPQRQQQQPDQPRDNVVVDDDEQDAASAGGRTTTTAASAYHQLGDPSEHYESDAEDQRFSQVKDDIQQDLQHLFDLEEEVKLESRQLMSDIDNSTSTHADDLNITPAQPKPIINVLLTGDDAGYLMKLLRLTSGPPFTSDEKLVLRDTIRSNVVDDVRVLCRNLRDADFDSFLVYHEDEHVPEEVQEPPADLFDTLQLFGQLKNAWNDIRTHGANAEKQAAATTNKLKAREAYEILVSMLLVEEDEFDGDDPTKENVDMYEEEKESIEDTKLFLNLWREIQALWQVRMAG
jgi:hypothetical protein